MLLNNSIAYVSPEEKAKIPRNCWMVGWKVKKNIFNLLKTNSHFVISHPPPSKRAKKKDFPPTQNEIREEKPPYVTIGIHIAVICHTWQGSLSCTRLYGVSLKAQGSSHFFSSRKILCPVSHQRKKIENGEAVEEKSTKHTQNIPPNPPSQPPNFNLQLTLKFLQEIFIQWCIWYW